MSERSRSSCDYPKGGKCLGSRPEHIKTRQTLATRSVNVFDIDAFQGASATAPPTPIQHAVFQLTDAKVNAQPTPDGYEAPADQSNLLIPWATAAATAAGKKRKRKGDTDFDDDGDMGFDDEEQENDDE